MWLAFAFVVALALIGLGAWYFKDSGFGLVSIGLPTAGLVVAIITLFYSKLAFLDIFVAAGIWLIFTAALYLGLWAQNGGTTTLARISIVSFILAMACFAVMFLYAIVAISGPNSFQLTNLGLWVTSLPVAAIIKFLLWIAAALGVALLIASHWFKGLKPYRFMAAIVVVVALVSLAIWVTIDFVKMSPVSQVPATAVPTQVSLAEKATPTPLATVVPTQVPSTAVPATAIPATAVPAIPATAIAATAVPATAIPATPTETAPAGLLKNQPAEYYFSGVSLVCMPVNGPWVEAFAKGQTYEVKGDSNVFAPDTFKYFEGTLVIGQPIDRHYTFEITKDSKFTAIQGNIWDCGVVISDKDKITTLFQSTNKKWQNWNSQDPKPFHPMAVLTGYNSWYYNAGIKPAWALNEDDTNLICPFTKPEMSNPLGEIQADGTFIGTPGKAGCDFLAIYPDGKAVRYEGVIERFPYPSGTRFFLFDPKFTNKELKTLLNLGKID